MTCQPTYTSYRLFLSKPFETLGRKNFYVSFHFNLHITIQVVASKNYSRGGDPYNR